MANQKRNRFNEIWQYVRATEAVSKPIAYLMMFFGATFIISLAVGLFLIGRWGYRKVVPLDEPVVITAPAESVKSDTPKQTPGPDVSTGKPNTSIAPPESNKNNSSNNLTTKSLPDTGVNFYVQFVAVFISGYLISRLYYLIKS